MIDNHYPSYAQNQLIAIADDNRTGYFIATMACSVINKYGIIESIDQFAGVTTERRKNITDGTGDILYISFRRYIWELKGIDKSGTAVFKKEVRHGIGTGGTEVAVAISEGDHKSYRI